MIGTAMASDLTAAGKTGVAIHARLRFLDALAALPGFPRRAAHPDRIGQRAAGVAHHTSRPTRSPRRLWATTRASAPGIIWSRGWAARGACATSSTTS